MGDPQSITTLLAWAALICAACAAPIQLWYLVRKPALTRATKILLLVGLGVLPLGTALTACIVGYEASMQRSFCGSCHVMTPRVIDATDRKSTSLVSMHSRNTAFGHQSCYTCHADYGMFGSITTKLVGLKHMWVDATRYAWTDKPDLSAIKLYHPYSNQSCMQCHSTTLAGWQDEPEHQAAGIDDVRGGKVSCVTDGCHGPAHHLEQQAGAAGASAGGKAAAPAPAPTPTQEQEKKP